MKKAHDFGVSAWECMEAEKAFVHEYQNQIDYNSRKVAINCGLGAVWKAARKYQAQLEAQERMREAFVEVTA